MSNVATFEPPTSLHTDIFTSFTTPWIDPVCCRKIVIGKMHPALDIDGVYINTGEQYNDRDYYIREDQQYFLAHDRYYPVWAVTSRVRNLNP